MKNLHNLEDTNFVLKIDSEIIKSMLMHSTSEKFKNMQNSILKTNHKNQQF